LNGWLSLAKSLPRLTVSALPKNPWTLYTVNPAVATTATITSGIQVFFSSVRGTLPDTRMRHSLHYLQSIQQAQLTS
jgi:hypothetical protein